MRRLGCKEFVLLVLFSVAVLTTTPAKAGSALISDVPSYTWYHGCEPTSIGMIFGYWDYHGYSNLFAAQGSNVYLTSNVQNEISSPQHIAANYPSFYIPTYPVPGPNNTSIADWVGTSGSGESSATNARTSIAGYASYKRYAFQTANVRFSSLWNSLVNNINQGRPMLFFVDSDSNGVFDHAVPAFGYDDRGGGNLWYACYTTANEDETPVWFQYRAEAPGINYGVYGAIEIVPPPIPEPATCTFLALGLLHLCYTRRKRC
jgi:hypothetical protein